MNYNVKSLPKNISFLINISNNIENIMTIIINVFKQNHLVLTFSGQCIHQSFTRG